MQLTSDKGNGLLGRSSQKREEYAGIDQVARTAYIHDLLCSKTSKI